MLPSIWSGEDPVANETRKQERAERRAAAKTAAALRERTGAAAGRDRRSIGVYRKRQEFDPADEM